MSPRQWVAAVGLVQAMVPAAMPAAQAAADAVAIENAVAVPRDPAPGESAAGVGGAIFNPFAQTLSRGVPSATPGASPTRDEDAGLGWAVCAALAALAGVVGLLRRVWLV
jgi:hypothetical protein